MERSTLILHFLRELIANNNREWFQQHRSLYEAANRAFQDYLSEVIGRIARFDEEIKHVQPKDCMYRIYRDTRFSPDKTPYKNHMGGYINARGKNADYCGYYIHFQPGECLLGGGSLDLPPRILKAVRQSIYDNIDEFVSFAEDPAFKQYFPIIGEDFVKTAPKGFPRDFEHIDYLRCRQYVCSYPVSDDFFLQPDAMDRIEEVFRQFKRFADFVNYTIAEFD